MGDDLLDLPVLRACGLSAAPADAAPEVRERVHWVSRRRGGRGAVREFIELVLRAQGAGTPCWPTYLQELMEGIRDPPRVLLALLAGLAIGKAWERYKLRDGRWIDRRRGRESPHYMLGLNFLVANQIDPAIEELTRAAEVGRRSARDPPDPRQPVSRKGPGRPRDPGAPDAAAAPHLRKLEHANVLLCLGLDYKHGGFVDRALEAFTEVLRLDPDNQYALSTSRSSTKSSTSGTRRTRRARSSRAAIRPSSRRAIRSILAFLENELGLQALKRKDYTEAARRFEAAIDLDAAQRCPRT